MVSSKPFDSVLAVLAISLFCLVGAEKANAQESSNNCTNNSNNAGVLNFYLTKSRSIENNVTIRIKNSDSDFDCTIEFGSNSNARVFLPDHFRSPYAFNAYLVEVSTSGRGILQSGEIYVPYPLLSPARVDIRAFTSKVPGRQLRLDYDIMSQNGLYWALFVSADEALEISRQRDDTRIRDKVQATYIDLYSRYIRRHRPPHFDSLIFPSTELAAEMGIRCPELPKWTGFYYAQKLAERALYAPAIRMVDEVRSSIESLPNGDSNSCLAEFNERLPYSRSNQLSIANIDALRSRWLPDLTSQNPESE